MTLLLALTLLVGAETAADAPAATPVPKAEILGLWKGRSICADVQAAEFCTDATVVYNFYDVPDQPATVAVKAARIVSGALQQTYAVFVTYRPEERRWTSLIGQPPKQGVWSYAIKGDELIGSWALMPELTTVLNVTAKRVSRDQVLAP